MLYIVRLADACKSTFSERLSTLVSIPMRIGNMGIGFDLDGSVEGVQLLHGGSITLSGCNEKDNRELPLLP